MAKSDLADVFLMFLYVTFSFEYVKNAVWVHKGWITEEILYKSTFYAFCPPINFDCPPAIM